MVSSSFRVMKYVSWCITNSTHMIGMSGVAEYAHYSMHLGDDRHDRSSAATS